MKYFAIDEKQARNFANQKTMLYGLDIDAYTKGKPVKGILSPRLVFIPVNTKTGKPQKESLCRYCCLFYADTYDEAIEMYNEFMQRRNYIDHVIAAGRQVAPPGGVITH